MLNNNYIILNIETKIDKEAMEKSIVKYEGFSSADEYLKHKQENMKDGKKYFPKLIFHKIHTIGMMYISGATLNAKYIDFCYDTEEIILYKFWDIFKKCDLPTIVGFNSKSFDMPIISIRTGKYLPKFMENDTLNMTSIIKRYHNTSDNWEKYGPNYLNRFSKYHIDLIEDFGYPRVSLIEACSLNNIDIKNFDHGSKIESMTDDDIRKYCCDDVITTTKLLIHHLLKYDDNFSIHDYKNILNKLNEGEY